MSENNWKEKLTEIQYHVTREKGTEKPFSGEYWDNKRLGKYLCVCCGSELFNSETKFESFCGWPSFYAPGDSTAVTEILDISHGMIRQEVVCSICKAHLGHVFPDGPKPTGLRYCINSASLQFKELKEGESC